MIFKRFINKKHAADKIKSYNKGCADTNIIRDKEREELKTRFRYELNKKNKTIKELQEIIFQKDNFVDKVRKDLPVLKRQLDEIECFVEQDRDENAEQAGRKLLKINETKRQIKKISKSANSITLSMLELTDKSNF